MKTADRQALDRGLIRRGGKKLCWHRNDFDEVLGCWRYERCGRCGRRTITRYSSLMGPIDWAWLETGEGDPLGDTFAPVSMPEPGGLPPAERVTPSA